jgi:hypothetical protein
MRPFCFHHQLFSCSHCGGALGEKSLQSHLRGVNFNHWRRSRALEAGLLGKIGVVVSFDLDPRVTDTGKDGFADLQVRVAEAALPEGKSLQPFL